MNAISNYTWGNNSSWAKANKNLGIISLSSGLLATTLGSVKIFSENDSINHKALNFLQSLFLGIRSFFQYSIYSRKNDDDLGEDIIKKPYAGNIGEVACFSEKYLNPILIPLTSLISKNIEEAYHSICHLPNALWWRSRMFAEKVSISNFDKNSRYDFYNLFSKNTEDVKVSSGKLVKKLSPLLGLIGFSFCGLFTPIKSWNKLIGNENKIINALSSLGTATQHMVYLLKFSLAEFFNYRHSKDLKKLILSSIGIGGNALNIGLPVIDLLPDENNFIKKSISIYKELASGFTMAFFSLRRHFMGAVWMRENSCLNVE